jgi:chemotaxis signal transduction protein
VNTNGSKIDAATVVATAATLRRLFDESFAAPAAYRPERLEDLLAIRIGPDPYALRLSEISGLHVGVKIAPVPSPAAELLGIVGIRGMMAPIYDLAALLRYPPAANPRWFIFAHALQPVGFAIETFESHLQMPRSSLVNGDREDAGTGGTGGHLRGTVRASGALRPIIHLASVLEMMGEKYS